MSASPTAENPLGSWRDMPSGERWQWWQERWQEAIALSERYRLALRSGWWEDSVRVEALAAYATWVATYDTGVGIDPAGKIHLLAQLDWLRVVLRGGEHAFDPQTDRPAFERYLTTIDARPPYAHRDPDASPPAAIQPDQRLERQRRELTAELPAIEQRLADLAQREPALRAAQDRHDGGSDHARRDLAELERTVTKLKARQQEISRELSDTS
ncbi:MAG TPA: hypothetical protein VMA77_26000 [Solirubrobacteraceae bacterium]|nr:hypothetical protein [Solirubrobacteraceae bacterium]